jgi:hypothetical protein
MKLVICDYSIDGGGCGNSLGEVALRKSRSVGSRTRSYAGCLSAYAVWRSVALTTSKTVFTRRGMCGYISVHFPFTIAMGRLTELMPAGEDECVIVVNRLVVEDCKRFVMSAIAGPAVGIVGMNISLAPGGPIQGASWRIPASIPAAVVPHDMGGLANACILSQSSLEQIDGCGQSALSSSSYGVRRATYCRGVGIAIFVSCC